MRTLSTAGCFIGNCEEQDAINWDISKVGVLLLFLLSITQRDGRVKEESFTKTDFYHSPAKQQHHQNDPVLVRRQTFREREKETVMGGWQYITGTKLAKVSSSFFSLSCQRGVRLSELIFRG